jgi:hypothetical protein
MRRPVARTVAAGAAAWATDHFRPTPNRQPTGERGEASSSTYILIKFFLWCFSWNHGGCGGEAWGWVTKVSLDPGAQGPHVNTKRPRVPVTRPLRARDNSFRVTQGTRGHVAYF